MNFKEFIKPELLILIPVLYVVGMGLNDAIYMLESRGLRVHFSGKGMIRQQSIPAGRKIQAGQTVSLTLR